MDENLTRNDPFVVAWSSVGTGKFSEWVRGVAESFRLGKLSPDTAARLIGASVAEVVAVLDLAGLEDEELDVFGTLFPPKTTWFLLAQVPPAALPIAVQALSNRPVGMSPSSVIKRVMDEFLGPAGGIPERVASLNGAILVHMAKKAEAYGALTPKSRSALRNMGNQKKAGKQLTPKQLAFVEDLLKQLVDAGAIRQDSPDGDVEQCAAVLDALGQRKAGP